MFALQINTITLNNILADKFCVLSLLSVLFSIFQKISIKNTVRLIESTEYIRILSTAHI